MRLALALAFVGVSFAFTIPTDDGIPEFAKKLTGEALRDYTNSVQNLWRAELETKPRRPVMDKKFIELPDDVEYAEEIIAASIPTSFDARKEWSECSSIIGEIRDQSDCGGCWAFGAAEAMSDRICIQTKGKTQVKLAADDPLSCCGSECGSGCNGGYPIKAWKWWVSNGLCTGGGYYENTGCKPYPIEPCGTHTDENGNSHTHDCPANAEAKTPACYKSCTNSAYKTAYASDKHKGKSAYAVKNNVNTIKTEIMTNGPVEAAFTVYEDFYQYTSGVYKHVSGKEVGGHAVKILGWGTDGSTPYWLVANSWDTDWGENGFFRIVEGKNECGIEAGIVAGLASV